jgi:hypothetical protein
MLKKEELFSVIDFIKNNEKDINKNKFHLTRESGEFKYPFMLFPLILLVNQGLFNLIYFSIFTSALSVLIGTFLNILLFIINFGLSFPLTEKIVNTFLKNNQRDDYSIDSLLTKQPEKDFKERSSKLKIFNKLLKNNLNNKLLKIFKTKKMTKILCNDDLKDKNVSLVMLEVIKKEYITHNSKKELMQALSEYTFNNYDTKNNLIKSIMEESLNYYKEESGELENKKMLLEASGLVTEKKEDHNLLPKKLTETKNKLKILSI